MLYKLVYLVDIINRHGNQGENKANEKERLHKFLTYIQV